MYFSAAEKSEERCGGIWREVVGLEGVDVRGRKVEVEGRRIGSRQVPGG